MKIRLCSIVFLIALVLNMIPGSHAFARQDHAEAVVITLECASNLARITNVDLCVQTDQVWIRAEDAASLSGFSASAGSSGACIFTRGPLRIVQQQCRAYQDDLWVALEEGLLLFQGREHTSYELFAITDKTIGKGQYNLSEFNDLDQFEWLTRLASLYNRLVKLKFFESVLGIYDIEQYRNALKMVINPGKSGELFALLKEMDSTAKELNTLLEFEHGKLSEEELMDLYCQGELGDWGAVISMYKNFSNPVDYFLKKAIGEQYSVSGLGWADQLALYQNINAFLNCEQLYSNMINYAYSGEAYKTATKGVSLPWDETMDGTDQFPERFLPSTAQLAVKDMRKFFETVRYEDLLVQVIRKEIETVTVETLVDYLEKELMFPSRILVSMQKLINEVLFQDVTDLIDYMETFLYLCNLQKGLPGLYERYRACDATAINAKYTALLYLRIAQAAYEVCVKKGVIQDEYNGSEVIGDAMAEIIAVRDGDLIAFSPNERLDISMLLRSALADESEPEPDRQTGNTEPNAGASNAEAIFYWDSLYTRFHDCSNETYVEEVSSQDRLYGRRENCYAQIDGVPIGYAAQLWREDFSARALIADMLNHDWYIPGSSGVEAILLPDSIVTLVQSELYGWGTVPDGSMAGSLLFYDEYYLFQIRNQTENGDAIYEVLFREGGEYEGGEWCGGKILSRNEIAAETGNSNASAFLGTWHCVSLVIDDEWYSLADLGSYLVLRIQSDGTLCVTDGEIDDTYEWTYADGAVYCGNIVFTIVDDGCLCAQEEEITSYWEKGDAMTIGLAEMDSSYLSSFNAAYQDFFPICDGSTGTGPVDGERWSVGLLLASRGTECYYVTNCEEWVSMRKEASADSPEIRRVYFGEAVQLIGIWNEWALVTDDDFERFGWILLQHLSPYDPSCDDSDDFFDYDDSDYYDYDDGGYYDDGCYCDYDFESEGSYWYLSTELVDLLKMPISPAVVAHNLSYDGRISIGDEGIETDSYTNGCGFYLIGSDDMDGVVQIYLEQYVAGYTMAGAYIGMEAEEAYDTIVNYFFDSGVFEVRMCEYYDVSIYVEFENACGDICQLFVSCDDGTVDSFALVTF